MPARLSPCPCNRMTASPFPTGGRMIQARSRAPSPATISTSARRAPSCSAMLPTRASSRAVNGKCAGWRAPSTAITPIAPHSTSHTTSVAPARTVIERARFTSPATHTGPCRFLQARRRLRRASLLPLPTRPDRRVQGAYVPGHERTSPVRFSRRPAGL